MKGGGSFRGVVKKSGYFTVRLTVSVPPPLTVSFLWNFYLRLWFYVFWNGFYTRKSQFSCNYWNPPLTPAALRMIICKRPAPFGRPFSRGPSGSSFARGRPLRMTICKRPVPLDHHLQEAGPPFWQPRQGRENCIFETLYNEKRCVLSVKESNINEKNQNFHICLRSGPTGLTP